MKILLYFWANSCYDSKAGLGPDDIIMPSAQLWEKAVYQYTTRPYLALGQHIFERWKTQ